MASFPRHRGEQELPLIAESRAGFEFWPRVPRESPTHSDVAPRSERHGTLDGLSMPEHEISLEQRFLRVYTKRELHVLGGGNPGWGRRLA